MANQQTGFSGVPEQVLKLPFLSAMSYFLLNKSYLQAN